MQVKTCTKCGVSKLFSEFHKRANRKIGIASYCKPCSSSRARAWQNENFEHDAARKKVWRSSNPELVYQLRKNWFEANPEKRNAQAKAYRERNPGKCGALYAAKRARKVNAEVEWADKAKIQEIYLEAKRLTNETGIAHHVDHIIPLRNKRVCGLHVESNLQILTAAENLKKYNKFSI